MLFLPVIPRSLFSTASQSPRLQRASRDAAGGRGLVGAELSDEESEGEGRNLMKGNQKVLPRVISRYNTDSVEI